MLSDVKGHTIKPPGMIIWSQSIYSDHFENKSDTSHGWLPIILQSNQV